MQRIDISYESRHDNPHMDDSDDMDHWTVWLSVQRSVGESLNMDTMKRTMTVYYSKGRGHNGEAPTLSEVLESLAANASSVQFNAEYGEADYSFEEWADEFGYDQDSRKAKRTYKNICAQSRDLWYLLGEDDFKAAVYETEYA